MGVVRRGTQSSDSRSTTFPELAGSADTSSAATASTRSKPCDHRVQSGGNCEQRDRFVEFGIEPEGATVVSRSGSRREHLQLHHDSAASDRGEGGADGHGGAGRLDGHVEVLIGQGVGSDPDGAVNADVQGDLRRVIEDVSGPDFRGAGRFGSAGGEDADGVRAPDEYLGATAVMAGNPAAWPGS